MEIIRDDYEIDRVRAWVDETLRRYLTTEDSGSVTAGNALYAIGVADVLDWMQGETNIAPDRYKGNK